jgi:hypothetical protein
VMERCELGTVIHAALATALIGTGRHRLILATSADLY